MNKIIKNIYIILFLISAIFFVIKAKVLYKYKGWFYKSILLVLSGDIYDNFIIYYNNIYVNINIYYQYYYILIY